MRPSRPRGNKMDDDSCISAPYPRSLLRRFLASYRDSPCLWDRSNSLYKNRTARTVEIQKLIDLVKEQIPETTKLHVLKRIEILRNSYRRERKKVIASRVRNDGPVHVPILWYYPLLKFLDGDDDEAGDNANTSNKDDDDNDFETYANSEEGEEEIEDVKNILFEVQPTIPEPNSNPHYETAEIPPNTIALDTSLNNSTSRKRHYVEIDDEYDAIGVYVAAKLRGLPPNIAINAERHIHDVLYQAQVNGLSSYSVIGTRDTN